MSTRINFWQVADNRQKLELICALTHQHFVRKERLLITVPNETAARYVDQLLWSSPPESFLPHVTSEKPIAAAVVITTGEQNLNQASILLNLCPTASAQAANFSQVHELLDSTSPDKEQLSRQREAIYRSAGHLIEIMQPRAIAAAHVDKTH